MLIEVLCVSRRPPRWISDGTAHYLARMPREFGIEFVHLAPGHGNATAALRIADEGRRLLARVQPGVPLIALDVGGREASSEQFAAALGELRERHRHIVLCIGGADGLGEAVRERATARWSLSRLTLPHLLCQVVLAEQIYRAWTILEGHPYHRG